MNAQDAEDYLRKQLHSGSGVRAHIAFVSMMALAYRNLHEQSDTGTILTPEQFIELLIAGSKAIRLEARGTTLRALCPDPSNLVPSALATDYILATVKTTAAEDDAISEFAKLMKKILDTKPTQGGTTT